LTGRGRRRLRQGCPEPAHGDRFRNIAAAALALFVHGKEVVEWSRCTHDEIRQIASCILNESWTLGRAIMFVEQSIHTNTTIKDLTTWVRTRGKPLRIKSGRKGEYTITVEQK
jgi:hypothetical protein